MKGSAKYSASSACSNLLHKAKKLSLQIPVRTVSDILEIVRHHTLLFDLELEELQRRQNERYWTVILSLLKKNNFEVWWECCVLGFRSVLVFTDAWWISGFKCFIKTIHLVEISKEDCGSIKSAICFLKVTNYAFSQQRQVISLLEPTESVTQLPPLFKASHQKAKEMSWLWSGQKALKSPCRRFLLLWHRKEWTDTMNK